MSIQFGNLTLFNVEELAKKFDMNPMTIRRLFREGRLKGKKMGRRWYLSEEALRTYFAETSKPTGTRA